MSLSGEQQHPNQDAAQQNAVQPFRSSQGGARVGLLNFFSVLRRRAVYALLMFCVVMGLYVAYVVTRQPLYQSGATIDLNPNGSSGSSLGDLLQERLGSDELNAHITTQVEVLRSSNLAIEVCDKINLLQSKVFLALVKIPPRQTCSELNPHDRDVVLGVLQQQIISVAAVPGTNLVRISATTPSALLSKQVANGVVDAYIDSNLRAGIAGTNRVGDWLANQMLELRDQVNTSQQSLSNYQRSKNVVATSDSENAVSDELKLIDSQIANAAADRIEKEARMRVAESSSPELMSSLSEGGSIDMIRRQRTQLQADYDQLTTKFGPNYPRVRELAAQIQDSQKALDKEVANVRTKLENDYKAALATETALNLRQEQKKQEAFKLNDSAAEYAILRHNSDSARDLYDAIQYKLRESGIMDTLKSAQIRMIEPPVEPNAPIFPRKARTLFYGFVVAFLSAIGLAFLVDRLDDALHTPDTIENAIHIPVLVTVPHTDRRRPGTQGIGKGAEQPDLVALHESTSAIAESYRALRSSVLLSNVDKRIHVQLIASGSQSEGKSFTACNYAITLAQQGSRVLLVDADLRRGSLHNKFGFPRSPGLTQLLGSSNITKDFVRTLPEVPNLDILTMGVLPPNPSEILNSRRLDDLIGEWRAAYDYIVIDSAPLLPVADSYGLAAKADGVLLVVRAEQTRVHNLQHTNDILQRIHAHVTGVIVNDVTSRSRGYQYNYYGDYNYSVDADKGEN